MYMYTSDSNWNIVTMNSYMTSGIPVLPYTQPNLIQLRGNVSSSSWSHLLSSPSPSIRTTFPPSVVSAKPLAPGELVLADKA